MPQATTLPSLKELLEAGVHFGHQRARSHPASRVFTYTIRDGIYVIDLEQTVDLLKQAIEYLHTALQNQKTILFVGTKTQYRDCVEETAKTLEMPYVGSRWLGGTLTNFEQIRATAKRLLELEKLFSPTSQSSQPSAPAQPSLTKKEKLLLNRELEELKEKYEGLKTLTKIPDILFVIDPRHEHTALSEAKALNVPVAAIFDTTTNPALVDIPIPANDDSRRSVELILKTITKALQSKEVTKREERKGEKEKEMKDQPIKVKKRATKRGTKKSSLKGKKSS